MASRFNTPPADPAQSADYHTAWCGCRKCATDWDAAHRTTYDRLLIGLLLAVIVAGVIAVSLGGAAA